jgi:hypothetical protein
MRMDINEIVLNELSYEIDSIIEHRMNAASGIEDYEHPVLTDTEIIPALDIVIAHYKTKIV